MVGQFGIEKAARAIGRGPAGGVADYEEEVGGLRSYPKQLP